MIHLSLQKANDFTRCVEMYYVIISHASDIVDWNNFNAHQYNPISVSSIHNIDSESIRNVSATSDSRIFYFHRTSHFWILSWIFLIYKLITFPSFLLRSAANVIR